MAAGPAAGADASAASADAPSSIAASEEPTAPLAPVMPGAPVHPHVSISQRLDTILKQAAAHVQRMKENPETQEHPLYSALREFLEHGRLDSDELPDPLPDILNSTFMGLEIWRYVFALLTALLVWASNALIERYVRRLAFKQEKKKAQTQSGEQEESFWCMLVMSIRRAQRVLIWGLGLNLIVTVLIPSLLQSRPWVAESILCIAFAFFFYDFIEVIDYYVMWWTRRASIRVDNTLIPLIRRILRLGVVLGAALHLYHVVSGNSVTTVIAGLGIGGMAVALAATDTIKNFIGFLMILLDKPFAVGDRIVFEGHDGVVEYVGLRTTRMRRLDSAQVSIPNSKAVDSVVHNIGRRRYLKRTLSVGLVYSTTPQQMMQALAIIRDILSGHECNSEEYPPRVFFTEFKDDNLCIDISYWYCSTDWWSFCRFNEQVNLNILSRLNEVGISMAFPTRTVVLTSDNGKPIPVTVEGGTKAEG